MRFSTFGLTGGMDVTTPIIAQKPGKALLALNLEIAPVSGYRRIGGIERFDGQPRPSTAADAVERALRRSAIAAVPGSGPVRGVFILKGLTYAFRNTADGLAKKLYVESAAGWTEVVTPALLPGGHLSSVNNNFQGQASTLATYGCDSVNPAFAFDGTTYTEIVHGAEPAQPSYVAEYKQHLFLAFSGGSVLNSVPGEPTNYSAEQGAGEIAVGDEIRALFELKGGALGIFCKDRIQVLSGTSALNFQLELFSDTGISLNTAQPMFSDAIYLDQRIQLLSSSDQFGKFEAGSISEPIRPLLREYISNTKTSFVMRSKNQYLLFTADGDGLVTTFNNGRLSGFTLVSIKRPICCSCTGEDVSGAEIAMLGDDDGFVYQWDIGNSLDGDKLTSVLVLHPNHLGNFELNKRFKKIIIESDSLIQQTLSVRAEFDYGAQPTSVIEQALTNIQGGIFDIDRFDECLWAGELKGYSTAYVAGHGRSIAIYVVNETTEDPPYILESMTIGFDIRGQNR